MSQNELLVQLVGTASLVMFIGSILALPVLVMKLPTDYFVSEKREPSWQTHKHPIVWVSLSLVKNLIGILLIIMGIAMLVLPGQGILTILIGIAVTNFPGKYALERRIACQPAVGNTLNKIRRLTGTPELILPTDTPGEASP